MKQITFTDEHGSFLLKQPENTNYLYFPLASETGLKSSVTPLFGGDAKLDQETFLLEPVSSENLHNNRAVRNFWCHMDGVGIFSAMGASALQEAARFTPDQDETELTAGFQWQTVKRYSKKFHLEAVVTSFIPVDCNVEILHITIKNRAKAAAKITPYGAIPIYGRSADNIRDHRNVTSMLHRIETTADGVFVCPTMSFDEKGHRPNHKVYYVLGCKGDGAKPAGFFPTVESFIGEGGFYTHPQAVHDNLSGVPAGASAAGREAMGACRFAKITLAPDESADYILLLGVEDARENIDALLQKYNTSAKVESALLATKTYWQKSVNASFHTKDEDFDKLMKWVCFQPFLRRLFGCSFLPHHDYGRGGRGWRDLWQDCLSLLLLEPKDVGRMIAMNYGGVRIDGTNATIIGTGDGNFIADRNGIARVWMDHALWPQMTTKLYIDQTGDVGILNREVPYFKDAQTLRGTDTDTQWSPDQGSNQLTESGEIYTGTILEHLLIQQLTAFYEVGDHNVYRLRGADWNDALDMASEHGESVAFTCAYAGNLMELAALLRLLDKRGGSRTVSLLTELSILLENDPAIYDSADRKREILSNYVNQCRHTVIGTRSEFSLASLAVNLTEKANWLMSHLRSQEWVSVSADEGWYNSYYDNHGRSVDGVYDGKVHMMLTGQVFSIMSGVADAEQISKITKSADRYLYQKETGGYRLNTDFEELKFDMGRMFGFAYGEKENGAVFSHMTVMYANALYRRGFVREGWKALKTLADTALDFDTSRIYPGIPEYFRADGRGMYHYLTGAASWYMLTLITEVFGVRGEAGDLLLAPKLLSEQFDDTGCASVSVPFAGRDLTIIYRNREKKDYGSYRIASAVCGKEKLTVNDDASLILPRRNIEDLPDVSCEIIVELV